MTRHPSSHLIYMDLTRGRFHQVSLVTSRLVASRRVSSRIGLDPFFHKSRLVNGGVNIMKIELLINLVRERPAIYDASDSRHRDRDVIAALWGEVATELKCTGETKILFIMDYCSTI